MIDQNHTNTQRRNLSSGQQPNKPQNICIALWESQTMLCKDLQLRKMYHKFGVYALPPPPPVQYLCSKSGVGVGGGVGVYSKFVPNILSSRNCHVCVQKACIFSLVYVATVPVSVCVYDGIRRSTGICIGKNLLHVIHANSPNLAGSLPIFG